MLGPKGNSKPSSTTVKSPRTSNFSGWHASCDTPEACLAIALLFPQSHHLIIMVVALLLLAAVGILAWGFSQAKPYGKPGILAWLQTVVLMAPWLLFFALSAAGVYLNLAGILLMVVSSAGLYIYLGQQLRESEQTELAEKRSAALMSLNSDDASVAELDDAGGGEGAALPALAETVSGEDAEGSQVAKTDQAIKSKVPEKSPDNVRPIPPEDLTVIEGIFGIDTFFRTQTIPFVEGAIFKGNLRGKPDETAKVLNEKLHEKLADRYCAFVLIDPEDKPVVLVQPSDYGPKPTSLRQKILAVVLAIASFATCLETASILQGFDIFQSPDRWPAALPIALGLATVLGVHDIGHRIVASKLDVKISPPFFLPAWQLGSFGSLMRFESILPNRSVLFDVSFAGPAAGGILSFALLFLGLVLSHPGSTFQMPAQFFQGSILVGTLARTVLGDALQADLVDVHPLMVIGWMGLIITAINVIPAGQLDGGRVIQAIYGRKTLVRSTAVSLVLLAVVGLFNPLALYWAVLIVFLQRQPERPCMDDLTEPDDARAALALLALLMTLLVLLPLTPSLASRLGIG